MTDIYDQELKLRNKTIKFRKWKVKDKKNYLENIKDIQLSREALIYNCIEDKSIVFDEEELKYVLICIRDASIKSPLQYTFICDNCKQQYEYDARLSSIMNMEGNAQCEIVVGDIIFEMDYPRNKEFYQQMILNASSIEAKKLIDFMLHVKSFNDNDGFTFEELNEYISNMDIDVFEQVLTTWGENMPFLDNVNSVECPHCKHEELYEFDALPGFFPESWRIE